MAETTMNVTLMAHTQLSEKFIRKLAESMEYYPFSDGQAVALTAIRTCYSPSKPSDILPQESGKYFGVKATDGEGGTEADRLIRHIMRSGHKSTVEHLSFTFAIEGVSRALLAQLTRHRVGFSYSVQSQRYVRFGSDDKSGGFDYVVPDSIKSRTDLDRYVTMDDYSDVLVSLNGYYEYVMSQMQKVYDHLRDAGVPAEDARAVLPQASACNLVLTCNLRSLLEFYGKRKEGRGGQLEITQLAESLRKEVESVEPWTKPFFEAV